MRLVRLKPQGPRPDRPVQKKNSREEIFSLVKKGFQNSRKLSNFNQNARNFFATGALPQTRCGGAHITPTPTVTRGEEGRKGMGKGVHSRFEASGPGGTTIRPCQQTLVHQSSVHTETDHMRSRLLRQTANMPTSFLTACTQSDTVVLLSASLLPLHSHSDTSSSSSSSGSSSSKTSSSNSSSSSSSSILTR